MLGKDLRIIFMGTPAFAVESLKILYEKGYNIVGVITAPDKPAGRGKKPNQSDVKNYCLENNLLIFQPEKLKDPQFIKELEKLKADLQVVVAFRMLPEEVWNMPRFGTFNLHASLLPQYRGAAPLNWAIINGETETGITTFQLDRKIDTGKILFREKETIKETDTVGNLHDRLMVKGANLVLKTVNAIAEGNVKPSEQQKIIDNKTILKTAPKLFKNDCRINWDQDTTSIRNLIRGLSPYPAAWTTLINKLSGKQAEAKIFFAEKDTDKKTGEPGTISSDGKNYLKIACKNGWLLITEIQLAGKKRMKITEFLRGFQNPEQYYSK